MRSALAILSIDDYRLVVEDSEGFFDGR